MINLIKVDKYLRFEKNSGRKSRLNWMGFISIKDKVRYNRLDWKTDADIQVQFYKQYRDPHWFMINPFSTFKHIWDILLTMSYLSLLVTVPLRITIIRYDLRPYINLSQLPIDMIFLIDIAINFCTGVYNPSTRAINYNPSFIAKNYIKGYFLIDLISSFPYDGMVLLAKYGLKENVSKWLCFLYLVYYIKLIRLNTFLSNFRKLLYMLKIEGIVLEIISIIVVWLLVSYLLITTLFFCTAVAEEEDMLTTEDPLQVLIFIHNTTNFIFTVTSRLTTIPSGNPLQIFGQLATYFITTIIEPFIGALVIVLYWTTRYSDIKYRAMVDEVGCYTDALNAPNEIKRKIRLYFQMYYYQSMLMDDNVAMDFFSGHNQQLILSHLVENMAMKVDLFRDLPPKIRLEMVKRLKREIIFTGYKLATAGQIGSKMYIISTGKIMIFTSGYFKITELGEGSCLGEYQLIADSPYPLTAVCSEISTVYTLDRGHFNQVLFHLNDVYQDIKEKITVRQMNLVILLDRLKSMTP